MKNAFNKGFAVVLLAFVSFGTPAITFAQFGGYTIDDGYGGYTIDGGDSGYGGYTVDQGYGGYTIDNGGGYGGYTVDQGYGGYTIDNGGGYGGYTVDQGYGGYTVDNSNDGYGGYTYTSPTYDYQPSYSYEPSYTYTPDYTYTPSWTGYDYTSPTYYTTPSYTGYDYTYPTYTSPTYGYTNYNYTNYTYPTTPVTPTPTVHTCSYTNNANVASYNQNYPSCTKVCTNGTTVGANATCPTVNNTCPGDLVRNSNGTCACPAGMEQYANNKCRVITTQQCNYTNDANVLYRNNNYPSCTKVCTNGTTVGPNATCPTITNNVVCSDGLPPVNNSCVRTTTIPVVNNTVCADGLPPINGTCIRTNTIPTTIQTICSDGSYPVNGSCTHIYTTPSINYQTCWDGTTLPLYSVCPSQYKTCANGTSIPVNQTCYYGNTYIPYTPPVTIKFNNVITSVATEITNASARCNGIGLIASGAPSVGWFEYGETPNLGRETAKANIGSSPTAPFSNKLTNLKPTTTYYCRAVMQNQFGTVKGEVVAFTTKGKATLYVAPVTKTTVKKTTTVTKKNEVICVDGKVVTVQSQSAADLINAGQKLVTLQIEKVSGNISVGTPVMYKLTLKNASDTALKNIMVKVTIPTEITLTNASAGHYDPTMHVLTIPDVTLPAYGDAVINWTGTVATDATVGKSTVTTAYVSYAVPGSQAQDEVTAYVVGTVVPGTDSATTTGAKHVIGAGATAGSFLPNSLIEWLALIAILFIIFILGRSVYTSYQSDKKASH